jgi:hypothetical protein
MKKDKYRLPPHLAKAKRISNLSGFVSLIQKFPNDEWIFRGETDCRHPLIPKAGRYPYRMRNKDDDIKRFHKWSHQSVAFSSSLPNNELERLAFARHHGLATRLLDWTLNAAAALYFATEDYYEAKKKNEPDGIIYFRRKPRSIGDNAKIWRRKAVCFYQPRPISPRINAQDGVFTYHPNPHKKLVATAMLDIEEGGPIPDKDLLAVIVPARLKWKLQKQLRTIGVLRRTLMPDIEGLSASINVANNLYNESLEGNPL